ncbi:MAG: 50S ribosomal protein L24 [Nanoarchaeota archaeon]
MKFSTTFKSSKKPRKQRIYRVKAPKHIKGKFLKTHLSKQLSEKYKKRTVRVVKGDKVTIMAGQFKGKAGKIEEVDVKNSKVYISGIEVQKGDGTKIRRAIQSSNIMITELTLEDKKRLENLK